VPIYVLLYFPFFSIPSLSFPSIVLLTSTGKTGEPITMSDGSNDAFPPKEVPFLGFTGKFGECGV
jgi:hypothetical protein